MFYASGPFSDFDHADTSCPGYKVIAVDVRPIGEEAMMTPALSSA